MSAATIETVALMGTPAAELVKAIESLTHRIHRADDKALRDVLREQRRFAEQELIRRSAAAERALIMVEATERLMRGCDERLASIPLTAADDLGLRRAIVEVRDVLDRGMEATTTLTCSLVKDQQTSDRIATGARRIVSNIVTRARTLAAGVE